MYIYYIDNVLFFYLTKEELYLLITNGMVIVFQQQNHEVAM